MNPKVRIMGALAALVMGLAASGCGIKGDLQPAPPLFGKARAQYEAQKKAADEAARAKAEAAARAKAAPSPAGGQKPNAGDDGARQSREIPVPGDNNAPK